MTLTKVVYLISSHLLLTSYGYSNVAGRVLHLETGDSTCLRRESQIRIINIITIGLDAIRLNALHLKGVSFETLPVE